MKRIFFLLAIALAPVISRAQDIRSMTSTDIMKFAASPDTVYIINFWATWCAPCVQELPEFNSLFKMYQGKPVKMLMVSLDFKDAYPFKLQGFVSRKRLAPEVAWLSETDPNVFIPRIEESWEGSLPATLIIKPGVGKKFIEGQVTTEQVARVADAMMEGK